MRILRNIIITLLLLALMGISIVGIMVELPAIFHYQPTRINELGRSFIRVMRPANGLLLMWIGVAAACLLVLLMSVLRPRRQMRIEVQMGGGRVVIMDSAIKRYIRSALSELPGITVRRIDLRDTRLGVSTDLYADVRAQGNLPVLERQMIQRVRAALAEDLGITSIGEVHVFIRDFEVAERVPVQTAVRRPQAREVREEESEPEPAQTAEVVRASVPEYTKPSGSTGPFDQVPMPAGRVQQPSVTAASGNSERLIGAQGDGAKVKPEFTPYQPVATGTTADIKTDENYFTPAPAGSAQVTDLTPKDIYVLSEAASESAGVGEAVSQESQPLSVLDEKPKKRGIFGMFGTAEASNKTAATEHSRTGESSYDPATATESVEPSVQADAAIDGPGKVDESPKSDASVS